jgi:hypothetical protein
MLEQYPEIRKYAYLAQWIINGIMGVIAVVLLIKDLNPEWFVIATAVFNFLWTYTGLQAQTNTPNPPVIMPVVPKEG